MEYDFNKVINRQNTNSIKYDFKKEYHKPEDILPLWVADMDFQAPKEVQQALSQVVSHGIFGYSQIKEDFYETVAGWYEKHFSWHPKQEWHCMTPGVVFAIAAAIRALTKEGEAVLIQQPVYYPFSAVVKENNRKLVNNELVIEQNRYRIDFEDFEQKIKEEQVKLFVLCSPHNPVGRVWSPDELKKIGEICLKHDVIIVSDEIHSDFVRDGHTHHIFADISEDLAEKSIICTSPSKTFNLAGLQLSNIWIPNHEIRKVFLDELEKTTYRECNIMGITACKAAYAYGEEWLTQLKSYLEENLIYIKGFLERFLPGIRLIEPEGTYLAWLDCSGLHLDDEQLEEFMVHKAKLWLDAGSIFGSKSGQFERVNLACPRIILEEAMERLKQAVDEL